MRSQGGGSSSSRVAAADAALISGRRTAHGPARHDLACAHLQHRADGAGAKWRRCHPLPGRMRSHGADPFTVHVRRARDAVVHGIPCCADGMRVCLPCDDDSWSGFGWRWRQGCDRREPVVTARFRCGAVLVWLLRTILFALLMLAAVLAQIATPARGAEWSTGQCLTTQTASDVRS